MSIKSRKGELIEKILQKSVELINKEADLDEFKETYFPDEDRVLWINIKGMEYLNTGYTVKDGQLKVLDKTKDKPTVTITLSEDVLLAIALGELSIMSAYMYGELDVEGDNYLRDLEIFRKMMEKYKHIQDKLKGGK